MHIRRESWPSAKWFMLWRGTWFVFGTALLKPVRAGDYTAADLTATDWTTVPAPLLGCPINTTSTGGGPPSAGSGGFASASGGGSFPPGSGNGGGGDGSGGPGTYAPLPGPDPGTGLEVTFSGIQVVSSANFPHFHTGDLDGPVPLTASGVGVWTGIVQAGSFQPLDPEGNPSGEAVGFTWIVTVTKVGLLFDIKMTCPSTDVSGGFAAHALGARSQTIHNQYAGGEGLDVYGGTAIIS